MFVYVTNVQREEWRVIPFATAYEASSLGRVRNKKRGNVFVPTLGPAGYWKVSFPDISGRRRTYEVHRVVGLTFLGEPQNRVVDHINGVRTDNRLANLRYLSRSDNVKGRKFSFTTPEERASIVSMRAQGATFDVLARHFGRDYKSIRYIVRNAQAREYRETRL